MACASALAELVSGRALAAARKVSREDVEAAVEGLPEASGHASQLAVEALRGLLDKCA
jgi:hypothetical protein